MSANWMSVCMIDVQPLEVLPLGTDYFGLSPDLAKSNQRFLWGSLHAIDLLGLSKNKSEEAAKKRNFEIRF
ncbi:hypothetical protein HBI14_012370 [Parastagonospora nodorum]|nr:hypothetical protein HBI14_012370 [Parastagonospora nodorum]